MEINKIQILIRSFLHETKEVVQNAKESQKWLQKFRDTLNYQDLEQSPLPYALKLLQEADSFNKTQKTKQMMRWAKYELIQEGVKEPTREQIMQKCKERYPEEFEEAQPPQQPRKPVVNPPPRRNEPMPSNKQIVLDWATDNGIDVDDANECWQSTMERNGKDADGKPINNWKAFVKQWCKTRQRNRK